MTETSEITVSQQHRLLLFGDSIAMGLGVRRRKYGQIVADELGYELVDYSHTGWTVSQSKSAYEQSPASGDIALIAHGVTEPILRPHLPLWLPLPRRWRRLGWMDPRPYYSTRARRRLFERVESEVRWRTKNFLGFAFGSYQLASVDQYRDDLAALKHACEQNGAIVVIVGAPDIDDRFFPGSVYEQLRYSRAAEEVAQGKFVAIAGLLDRWSDYLLDHFHPSDQGHESMARLILKRLEVLEIAGRHPAPQTKEHETRTRET